MKLLYLPAFYKKLKRGPQVITPKDIGIIISYTGIGKDSFCVDAGTGSGWLAVSLARVSKKVVSYELREDFKKIAEKNKIIANVDNLEIKLSDVLKGIKEKDVDLITLDLPNSEKAVKYANKSLKEGGYLVGYLPNTEQVKRFMMKMEHYNFTDMLTIEVIVRDILVRKEGVRPSTKGIWHTAYLVFGRKHTNSEKVNKKI